MTKIKGDPAGPRCLGGGDGSFWGRLVVLETRSPIPAGSRSSVAGEIGAKSTCGRSTRWRSEALAVCAETNPATGSDLEPGRSPRN